MTKKLYKLSSIFLLLLSCFNIYAQTNTKFNGFPAAEKSIWKICSSVTQFCGTGFFIDKDTFVTNLHVVDSLGKKRSFL